MALRRKIKLNEAFFQGEVWIPAAELVKKYRCPRLLTLTEKNYSKLGSIGSPGGVVTKALCRALLTDRGMLFAQTREKGYPQEVDRNNSPIRSGAEQDGRNRLDRGSG